MRIIDNFLNSITMYRLLFYYLLVLVAWGAVLAWRGNLPFSLDSLIFSTIFLFIVCLIFNKSFATVFKVPTNVESVYITSLILALIVTPAKTVAGYDFLFWVGVLAVSSKFILAINKKHLFNPAAIAVVITAFALNQPASWWVGTSSMLPVVIVGGLLLVRKIRRNDLVISFVLVSLATTLGFTFFKGGDLYSIGKTVLVSSPLLFFGFVMVTEPATTPPTKNLQIIYGGLVGFLTAPQIHYKGFYTTPEIALVVGNLFSYLVSSRVKLDLVLKEKVSIGADIYDFVFGTNQNFHYVPGQYLEWTLPAERTDDRGNRRYFTIASSPTENDIHMGVKFYPDPSSFKMALGNLKRGDRILAGALSGEFVLPRDPDQKLVFIAGGIGITPFRAMVKYLIDRREKREITLFYSNKTEAEIAYKEIFDQAQNVLGVKTVYILSDKTKVPPGWGGKVGYLNAQMIMNEVPDWTERTFYISGPHSLVTAFEDTLSKIGVKKARVKIDFFPGYA